MDWRDLAGALAKAGAPIIGAALGGPLGGMIGGAIGNVLAESLGTEATPAAVNEAITRGDPADVAAKLSAADAQAQAKWPALADMVKAEAELGVRQVEQTGETMRAELQLAGLASGRARNVIAFIQAAWRPYIMVVWGTSLPFQLAAILHKAYARDAAGLAELSSVLYALAVWNAGPAGLAGVYAWGRTREKLADLVPLPGAVGKLVRTMGGRR